jgi:hypothetical protein
MRRREFIALIGGATAWPARAQVRAGVPTIGFLGSDAAAWSPWTAAFVDRLRQLGWIDGRTVAIEYRWSPPMCLSRSLSTIPRRAATLQLPRDQDRCRSK